MKTLMNLCLLLFFMGQTALGQTEYGMASYYSDKLHGNKTASGEVYDMNKLTAAHKTLPFGTNVRVTRLDNRKSIVVKINDRGPFVKGAVIDVSKRAARELDLLTIGKARVKVTVVGTGDEPVIVETITDPEPEPDPPVKPNPSVNTSPVKEKPSVTVTETKKPATKPPVKPATASKPVTKPAVKPVATTVANPIKPMNNGKSELYKVQMLKHEKSGFGVQVASFTSFDNVTKKISDLQDQWFKNILVSVVEKADGSTTYKIILGPLPDQKTATAYKKSVNKKGIKGFVVNLGE